MDDQERLVISTKEVEMTVNKNKCKHKYMALRQNKRLQGKFRKTCQRRTNPFKDPQGTW